MTKGTKTIVKESAKTKAENAIAILQANLEKASLIEKPSIQAKIDAWKKKI